MIDIHSHVLPMVDDGAKSVRMALDMLIQAYEHGTDEIVLTPHFAYDYNFINPKDKIRRFFSDLKRIVEAEHIPIKMYLGCEYLMSDIEIFHQQIQDIQTMNDTRYLLMEFHFNVEEKQVLTFVKEVLANGFIPIIAHAERFQCIQLSTPLAKKLIDMGCVLQMNKGSVLGEFGERPKECAFELLEHHYYKLVGSDTHHPIKRNAKMNESYDLIKEYFGRHYTEDLFYYNAKDMIRDIDIRKEDYEKY